MYFEVFEKEIHLISTLVCKKYVSNILFEIVKAFEKATILWIFLKLHSLQNLMKSALQ